jgi:hypothetical protein
MEENSIKNISDKFIGLTNILLSDTRDHFVPIIKNLHIPDGSKQKAISDTYFRMYCWMCSLEMMKDILQFQGVLAASRSLFELFLDIKILSDDSTDELVDKFYAFTAVERYRVAKQTVKFYNDNNITFEYAENKMSDFIDGEDSKEIIDKAIEKYWGRRTNGKLEFPKHWHENSTRLRTKKLDEKEGGYNYEQFYINIFSVTSWYIHSGGVGIHGVSDEALFAQMGKYHLISQYIFRTATVICSDALKAPSNESEIENAMRKINERYDFLLNQIENDGRND